MSEKIAVDFTFDELAGLYFIANAGLLSFAKDVASDNLTKKEYDLDYRETILNFRGVGKVNEVINVLDVMRGKLAEEAQKNVDSPEAA
jgi:hypothetical protein